MVGRKISSWVIQEDQCQRVVDSITNSKLNETKPNHIGIKDLSRSDLLFKLKKEYFYF